jgi:hypothetical protein
MITKCRAISAGLSTERKMTPAEPSQGARLATPKIGDSRDGKAALAGGNAGKDRPKGAPNRATRELKALAQQYTERAVDVLAAVMGDAGAPHPARVTAAVALLDRGHGKPAQAREITGVDGKDLIPPAESEPRRAGDPVPYACGGAEGGKSH